MREKMSEKVENSIKEILRSKVRGSEISEFTGLQESQVSRMRSGIIDISNIKLHTVKSLLDYYESERFQLHIREFNENQEEK